MSGTGSLERVKAMMRRLVEYNLPRMGEYHDIAFAMQERDRSNEAADLLGMMESVHAEGEGFYDQLDQLPEADLAELEAALAGVLEAMGQGMGRGPEARPAQFSGDDFLGLLQTGPSGLERGMREWAQGTWEVFRDRFWDSLRQEVETGIEGLFSRMTGMTKARREMLYLQYRLEEAEKQGGERKGNAARELRRRVRGMGIDALFMLHHTFMNETLRDFLNLKEDGTGNYVWTDMSEEDGWSEFSSFGSQMHQATASPEMVFLNVPVVPKPGNYFTRLNAKFTNRDGREAVFNCGRELITDYPDKGTYNYYPGENILVQAIGIIPVFGQHNRWDMAPYTKLMNEDAFRERIEALARENGGSSKWNPGVHGNRSYWQFDAGNGREWQ